MPSRRRSTTIRRPRVAGLTPTSRRADDEQVAGASGAAEPAAPAAGSAASESAAPGSAAPGSAAPGSAAPGSAAPESAAPGSAAPGSAAPGSAAPESTAPESTAPESTAPESTAPESTAPESTGSESTPAESTAAEDPPTDPPAAEAPAAETPPADAPAAEPAAEPARGRTTGAATSRLRSVPVLAGALLVFLGLAVFFGVMDHQLRNSPSASNTALVDVAATAEAAGQLSDALETVYSYDFARLDENERAAREVITPEFAEQFDALFAEVRELAPQQQAVVSATVTHSAVQSIDGDRAVMVAFMNQQATRTAPGAESEQLSSAGRITVTGEKVDGRWKIANVEVR